MAHENEPKKTPLCSIDFPEFSNVGSEHAEKNARVRGKEKKKNLTEKRHILKKGNVSQQF